MMYLNILKYIFLTNSVVRWKFTQLTSGLRRCIFIQQQQACRAQSCLGRQERGTGPQPDCSRRERSKVNHITQGLYRLKLAFSDSKALEITTWWVSHIRSHLAICFLQCNASAKQKRRTTSSFQPLHTHTHRRYTFKHIHRERGVSTLESKLHRKAVFQYTKTWINTHTS